MEYVLLIHKNTEQIPSEAEWKRFIEEAIKSGMFRGGSEFGNTEILGKREIPFSTELVAGFMRFDSSEPETLKSLLMKHPVVKNGGSVELIEMPKSS